MKHRFLIHGPHIVTAWPWPFDSYHQICLPALNFHYFLFWSYQLRQLGLLRHVMRSEGFEKLCFNRKVEGTGTSARQRVKYLDIVCNCMHAQASYLDVQDRASWNFIVVSDTHDITPGWRWWWQNGETETDIHTDMGQRQYTSFPSFFAVCLCLLSM